MRLKGSNKPLIPGPHPKAFSLRPLFYQTASEVTEHRWFQRTGSRKCMQVDHVSSDVTASVQGGSGVRAWMTQWSVEHRTPMARFDLVE